ncbi:hypothetical protein CEN44_01045 [Fischerella muscicola CCMEE 5323]|jgi:hypothetical protein|uniref:Uncharacterized protein n=1 Tax=Fischerella muscicola CCMEE 5323 TaxID=2019572 RepID=A0A2N6K8Y3_FISMU|nr:hypothetical protein [Fischerella muscicola]PLZ94343.1 hypothetical protein CEN44_01045 [Fischerella muscicola CCMEE 5323]PMB53516.1 hypothetical protein CEN39_03990 [Fischerella thermalis CCMEE 5201]
MPQNLLLCQTSTRGWLNLAYARQIHIRPVYQNISNEQPACFITWSNGDKETFVGKDAKAIAQTWHNYLNTTKS